jgi:hypothetical protein
MPHSSTRVPSKLYDVASMNKPKLENCRQGTAINKKLGSASVPASRPYVLLLSCTAWCRIYGVTATQRGQLTFTQHPAVIISQFDSLNSFALLPFRSSLSHPVDAKRPNDVISFAQLFLSSDPQTPDISTMALAQSVLRVARLSNGQILNQHLINQAVSAIYHSKSVFSTSPFEPFS